MWLRGLRTYLKLVLPLQTHSTVTVPPAPTPPPPGKGRKRQELPPPHLAGKGQWAGPSSPGN